MNELFKPLTGTPLIASVAAATPAGAAATASTAIGNLPPALADLTAGTVIAGIVVERARGLVLLKTDKGMLQVQTNLSLNLGAAVVLEVQSVGAQVRLAILSVDQKAPPDSPEATIVGQTPTSGRDIERTSRALQAAPQQLVGRAVTATVVGPPESRLAGEAADPTLPILLRRLIAISALARVAAETAPDIDQSPAQPDTASPQARGDRGPSPPPATAGSLQKSSDASPMEPLVIPSAEELEAALKMLPPPAREIVAALLDDGLLETPTAPQTRGAGAPVSQVPSTGADQTPALQASSEHQAVSMTPKTLAIRILAQSPPPVDSMSPIRSHVATRSDAITLIGTVVANDATGTEIATPIGRLRLPVPVPIATGTRITFEILSRIAEDRHAQPERTAEPTLPTGGTAREWPAVRDVAARWPEAADLLLPKAGQPLGPALLAFIAAVRGGGNLKAWLGSRLAEAAESPDKKELIARLGQELATQARSAASTKPDGWQTIAVPVIDADRVSELRFRFRKRERRDGGTDGDSRRFVVQATLSALGPLQIDGTVRERHLGLIVRTARALPAPMRRDISDVFARSLAETNYRGEIQFREEAIGDAMPGTVGHGSGIVV